MRPTSSQTEEDGGSRVADEQTVPPRRAPHEPIRRLASYVVAALWVLGATIAGCGSDKSTAPAATPPAATNQTALPAAALPVAGAAAAAAAPAVPAPAVTQASWAPDALEELLAPIALYPDPLLSQILAASVNAQEVLDAGNW
ncbi:MAG TPA: DUF3300 domain-containing protein, partial [Povalibacter sp.]|nr:DUF3300 domain-containing protein [Povalibacter sp.]